jgi:hypothetical protein
MLHGRDTWGFRRVVALVCAVVVAGAFVPTLASGLNVAWQTGGAGSTTPQSAVHSIAVAFNYDFTKNAACGPTMSAGCVTKFRVFDISVPGKAYLLFTIAVPPGASGKTNLIKAASPRLPFVVGRHRLGVSAVTAEGAASDPALCSTIVMVGPNT